MNPTYFSNIHQLTCLAEPQMFGRDRKTVIINALNSQEFIKHTHNKYLKWWA